MVELIVVLAGVAIVAVVAIAGLSVLWELSRAKGAREDYVSALVTGAQPPSLHPRIDLGRCIGSGGCVTACPENDVLAVLDGVARVINPTSCIGHGECMKACPVDAITLVLGSDTRGVDIPMVDAAFQTNVPGLFVVGELGGMGLLFNATSQALQCMQGVVDSAPARVEGVRQVVIVGAGPAGLAASLAALEAGLDFVTVDQDSLGGTVLQYPRHKLVMTRPVLLPLYGALQIGEIRKEELLEIWMDVVEKTGLQVRSNTRVEGVELDADGLFTVRLPGEEVVRTQRVVLAMGRRGTPRKLGVPGEERSNVVYRLLEPERYEGRRCLVVGGGDSALEAAVALSESGARVTLSYRKGSFSRAKKKNRLRIQAKMEAELVTFVANSVVRSIQDGDVTLAVAGAERAIPTDDVLIFAGGKLPTQFLTNAGVVVERFTGQAYAPANPGLAPEKPTASAVVTPPQAPVHMLKLHECLGTGAHGEVYRATRTGPSGQEVLAVKVLRKEVDPEGDAVSRLRDEAQLLCLLDHPSILKASELRLLDGRIAMMMEYVNGMNLAEICRIRRPPECAAVEIIGRVAGALQAAWTTPGPSGEPLRLVHRDVKPSNVAVDPQGRVKLLDFGVARADMDREASTNTGMAVGTYQYMAPECFRGATGAPGDVFALGCTLYKLLTGRRLFRTSSIAEHYGLLSDPGRFDEARADALSGLIGRAHPLTQNLIGRTLCFEPAERPRTEDLVTLFKQLSARLDGEGLATWIQSVPFDRPREEGELSGLRFPLD